MRVSEKEFQTQVAQVLADKPAPSSEFESALFACAEDLLATRRERLDARETKAKRRKQVGRNLLTRSVELISIRPDVPAIATAVVVLLVAFFTLHTGQGRVVRQMTYSDLPDFPRINDASARYDAQRQAEQKAYEREVEDAHQRTSGGI